MSLSRKTFLAGLLGLALIGCGNDSSTTETPIDTGPNPGDGTNPGTGGGPVAQSTVSVGGATALVVQSCGVIPAAANLPGGTYTITLGTSTLSKGNVATADDQAVKSSDNYVLVNLPLGAGAKGEDHRFFMLNGLGSSYQFTLAEGGKVQAMFIDSDQDANTGVAALTIQPGNYQLKVDAAANVLRWKQGCNGVGGTVDLKAGSYTLQLSKSNLSTGGGSKDDYVVVRTPSEDPSDDHRYVVVNGLNGKSSVSFNTRGTLRAWAIGLQSRPSGDAILSIY